MPNKIVGALLAAGASTRFGSAKQLARIGDRALIDIALDALNAPSIEETFVILGCNFDAVAAHLTARAKAGAKSFEILFNPDWSKGLSASIHVATNHAIQHNATHVLLVTCDQPRVDSSVVEKLAGMVDDTSVIGTLVACKYGDSVGIPAIIPSRLFGALLQLSGDKGAKSLIESNDPLLLEFEEANFDVDYIEDLNKDSRSATAQKTDFRGTRPEKF